MELLIRPAFAGDEDAWMSLWGAYCEFYETVIPAQTTAATWARIMDPGSDLEALVAVAAGEVIGIANYLPHPRTWSERPTCYLEDLFVTPAARGRGAGRALIERLLEICKERGWSPLYWHTQLTNATARRLYDSFAPADGFVRYTLPRESQ